MLPIGTVTFLFTDIAGSTRMLATIGSARYEGVLDSHRRLLREAFAQGDGHEVDTQGDSFFVAFRRAQDAARAATLAQRALAAHAWADGERVHVRMGIHTTEATPTATGYVGMGVHRAARIAAAAHGGQVVISQAARELLEDESGFECADLGEHALKDFPHPQRLYQLHVPGLPQEFPPVRTLDRKPTNLPAESTELLGREAELDAIRGLARRAEARVITLTGPGGTGKTRLALRCGADLAADFAHGAFAVMLASIREPELVLPAIAQALGVREAAGQSLQAYLAPKVLLLILDNVEQITGCAGVLAALLANAPGVKLLVTSREALHLAGERVFPVPPLALPDRHKTGDLAALSRCPSVRLFVERAQCVDPGFALAAGNAGAIAQLCARLDGLPLAIELAAARISLLSPEGMLKRLDSRLKLLTGGARDAPARQQTLRNTLAWSHELLSDEERTLFARLGVFGGGFVLEAAEAVAEANLETLGALVDRSMVRRDGERFAMLETIHEFALERLLEREDAQATRERYAAHFEALAERCHARRWHHEKEGLDLLAADHDNLRAALDHLSAHDPQRALRLAGALGWFWHLRSHLAEGRVRLAAVLAATSGRDAARARALAAAGEIASWSGDLASAKPLIDEAVAIWREGGEQKEVACALVELGWGSFFCGDPAARAVMEEGLALQLEAGDPLLVNRARVGLCQVLVGLHELEPVERIARETMAVAERLGDLRSEHFAHHFLGDCSLIRSDCRQAVPRYRKALALAVEIGDRAETSSEIQGMAMACAGNSQPQLALRLAGAAAAEFDALAIDITGITFWMALLDRYLGIARAELGADAASAAWEEGRRTRFEDAVALAMAVETATPAVA